MVKSYRIVVAAVFVFMSFVMLKSRLNPEHHKFDLTTLEVMGLEERELLISALDRLVKPNGSPQSLLLLKELLAEQTVPVWIASDSFFSELQNKESKLYFEERLGLIIPRRFFLADPFTQEALLSSLSNEIQKTQAMVIAKLHKNKLIKTH